MKSIVSCLVLILVTLIPAKGRSTALYLLDSASPLGRISLSGNGLGCFRNPQNYSYKTASTVRGSGSITKTFAPTNVAPPCLAQTTNTNGDFLMWASPPLASSVVIDGNINYSLGCRESNASMNAGFRFVVKKWSAKIGGIESVVHTSPVSSECSTTLSLRTIAASAPTPTTFTVGDRIVITVEVMNVGTWGGNSSRTFRVTYRGTASSTGDSFVNFSDTLSFATDGPSLVPTIQ
ncbi:MAG: hypothetical protein AB7O96_19560 [Pseudobdellovibrionaceae bacterium]